MIDTPAKRMCMLNFADGSNLIVLPTPDGAYDVGDIQHLLDLYCGITFSGLETVIVISSIQGDRGTIGSLLGESSEITSLLGESPDTTSLLGKRGNIGSLLSKRGSISSLIGQGW